MRRCSVFGTSGDSGSMVVNANRPQGLSHRLEVADFSREMLPAPAVQRAGESPPTEPYLPMLRLTIANTGSRHGYIRQPQLFVSTRSGRTIRIGSEALRPLAGQVVFKESAKNFHIAWHDALPPLEEIESIRLKLEER